MELQLFGDPRTEDEQRYVTWLMSFLIPAELDPFSAMVERRVTQELRPVAAIAYDRTLTAPDAMRRLRDLLGDHLGVFDDPDETL